MDSLWLQKTVHIEGEKCPGWPKKKDTKVNFPLIQVILVVEQRIKGV